MAADQDEKRGRTVLLPAQLWDAIKRIADEDHRTINGQFAALIEAECERRDWDRAIAANREAQEA